MIKDPRYRALVIGILIGGLIFIIGGCILSATIDYDLFPLGLAILLIATAIAPLITWAVSRARE